MFDLLPVKILRYIVDQQDRQYNHDALNCTFQLVAHGHDDMALEVFRSLRPMYGGTKQGSNSNALLRNMVIRGRVSVCFTLCDAAK